LIPPDLLLDVYNPAARPGFPGCPEEQELPEVVGTGPELCSSSKGSQTDVYPDLLEGLNHVFSHGP